MKKALFILLCLGMAFSSQAGSGVHTVDVNGFNKVFVSYSPSSIIAPGKTFNGNQLGVTYTRSQSIARIPFYIEFGAGFQYTNFSNNGTLNMYSINVPVDVAYRFSFKGGKMHLAPFTGPYFRFNVSGKYAGINIFDRDYNRFQFGWQEGVAFSVRAFYVSLSYAHDFSKLADISASNKISGLHIGLGVVF